MGGNDIAGWAYMLRYALAYFIGIPLGIFAALAVSVSVWGGLSAGAFFIAGGLGAVFAWLAAMWLRARDC